MHLPANRSRVVELTLDDIVFENRHKAYGAYDLRQYAQVAMQRALYGGIGLFSILFMGPVLYTQWQNLNGKPASNDRRMTEVIFCPPPEPIVQEQKPIEKQRVETVRYVEPVVKTEVDNQPDPQPTVDELAQTNVGPETVEGTLAPIVEAPVSAPMPIEIPEQTEVMIESTFEAVNVEVQPEFTGGLAALRKYLQKNLNYPPAAVRSGVAGRVFVQFTVEPDGSLANITTLRGIGFGCDEEAMRVIRQMPIWKPGKQAGRNVRVRFNLPIVFALE